MGVGDGGGGGGGGGVWVWVGVGGEGGGGGGGKVQKGLVLFPKINCWLISYRPLCFFLFFLFCF